MKIVHIVLFSLLCSACTVRCMRIEPSMSAETAKARQEQKRKEQEAAPPPPSPHRPPTTGPTNGR